MKIPFILIVLFTMILINVHGQAPVIHGDSLLCPNSTGTLSTQEYDSYQWYYTFFGSSDTLEVPGGNTREIEINYGDYVPSYFKVRVTKDSQSYESDVFLVDGLVFIPVTVQTTGEFTIGPNGESLLCDGDTLYFSLLLPYTENITWYKDGLPLESDTTEQLVVAEPGTYWVSAAPGQCPEFITGLGVELQVLSCGTSRVNSVKHTIINSYPNPVQHTLYIPGLDPANKIVEIRDLSGRQVIRNYLNAPVIDLDVSDLRPGIYFIYFNDSGAVGKFIKH